MEVMKGNRYRKKIAKMLVFFLTINIIFSGFQKIDVHAEDTLYFYYDKSPHKYRSKLVNVVIDGKDMKVTKMPAIILPFYDKATDKMTGKTMVPVREALENEMVGATVEWVGETRL